MRDTNTKGLISSKSKYEKMRKLGSILLCFMLMAVCFMVPAFAEGEDAATDPLTVLNNLEETIFSFVKVIGAIAVVFGVVQLGTSLMSHDTSQRVTGFMAIGGGILIFLAPEILDLIQ